MSAPPAIDPEALRGRTCLVTGAASGLGKAIAVAFLKAGAQVVACDSNRERMDAAAAELQGLGSLLAVTADVTDRAAMQRLFDDIASRYGMLDVLVNNAAIMDRFEPVGDVDLELWDRVMAVNLTAPLVLSQMAVRLMLQKQPQPDGCIINIGSVAAKAGWLAGTAYTTSKHGVSGLTKNTAAFYGPKGIRCNALLMGTMVDTNIADAFRDRCHAEGREKLGGVLAGVPAKPCPVDEAAALCVSLAYGAGWNLVNGSLLAVDNGWMNQVG